MLNATQLVGFGGKAKTGAYYSAVYLGKLADDRYVSISGSDVFVLDASFNLVFKKTLTGCTVSHYDGESILHGWKVGSTANKFVFSKLTIGSSDITVDAQYEVDLNGSVNATRTIGPVMRSASYVFFTATSYGLGTENLRKVVRCPIADMATRLARQDTLDVDGNLARNMRIAGDELVICGTSRADTSHRKGYVERFSDGVISGYSRVDGSTFLFPFFDWGWSDPTGNALYYTGIMNHVPTGYYVARLASDNITHAWTRQLPAIATGLWADPDDSNYLFVSTATKLFKIAKSDGAVAQGYDAGQAYTDMRKPSSRPYIWNYGKIFTRAVQHSFRNGSYRSQLVPNSDTMASISAPPNLATSTGGFTTITPTYSATSLTTVDTCSATQPIIYRV